jgi:DNA sulfur modification protein DndE
MILETIRLSQDAKEQLVRLKRHTGLTQWNVLCRWALLRSLAEPTDPPNVKVPADSNVEMAWRVFAGAYASLFEALVTARYAKSGRPSRDRAELAEYFRQHLHRGIGTLAGDRATRSIANLVQTRAQRVVTTRP